MGVVDATGETVTRTRRSNVERTATTQRGLLAATVDCLYRYGFGATTCCRTITPGVDFHYRLELPWLEDATARLSVLNVTDEDPMAAQTRNRHWSGVGNARGRQVEVGLTKKF